MTGHDLNDTINALRQLGDDIHRIDALRQLGDGIHRIADQAQHEGRAADSTWLHDALEDLLDSTIGRFWVASESVYAERGE